MNHLDIVKLAVNLAEDVQNKDEAYLRNIVGRSYYGAYHQAVMILEYKLQWPASPEKHGVHEKVVSRLENYPENLSRDEIKFIEQLKDDLIRIKKKRGKADYRLQSEITKAEALYVHKLALRLIRNLEKLVS